MIFQDKTGIIYLNYESIIPLFGNLLFGWKKLETLLKRPATAEGWFLRGATHHIELNSMKIEGQIINSYTKFWYIFSQIFTMILYAAPTFILIFFVSMFYAMYLRGHPTPVTYNTIEFQNFLMDIPSDWNNRNDNWAPLFLSVRDGNYYYGPRRTISMFVHEENAQWNADSRLINLNYGKRYYAPTYTLLGWEVAEKTEIVIYEDRYRYYFIKIPLRCPGIEQVILLGYKANSDLIASDDAERVIRKIGTSIVCKIT